MNLLDLAGAALAEFERTATATTPAPAARQPVPEPVCAPADPFPALPTCEQCLNLRQRDRDGARRCAAAARGELPYIANKRYCPAPEPGRRCEGFKPQPGNADQRNGRERWPELSGALSRGAPMRAREPSGSTN